MDEIQQLFEALTVDPATQNGVDDKKSNQTKPQVSQFAMTVELMKKPSMHDFVAGYVSEIVDAIPKGLKSSDVCVLLATCCQTVQHLK